MMQTVYDHEGNVFPSKTAMFDFYGLEPSMFYGRRQNGWSLEEALTGERTAAKVYDHCGNGFRSVVAMCDAYQVLPRTFYIRRKRGWTLKEALTGERDPIQKPNVPKMKVYDHLGNGYPTLKAMCECYGISYCAFRTRKKRGWPMEKILMQKVRAKSNGKNENEIRKR